MEDNKKHSIGDWIEKIIRYIYIVAIIFMLGLVLLGFWQLSQWNS